MDISETLKLVNTLIKVVGVGMTLGDAKTWLEVSENAERLKNQQEPNEEAAKGEK